MVGCWLCLWLVVDRIDHISTSSPGCGCCGDGGWCLVVCLLWLLVIVATSPVLLKGVVVVEVEDDVWLCVSSWLLVVVATSPVLLQGVVVVEVEDGGGSSR